MTASHENTKPRKKRSTGLSCFPAFVAIFCIATAACSRSPQQADLRSIPGQNVLLITIDTLRADALSTYGGRAATPALDRLAAEGVRFDFAHAHAVVTLPAHASILTGMYPFQHGLRDNSGYRLPAGTRTIATMLKERGYATGAFVGAFPLNARFGLNTGFDVYDDRFGETQAPVEFAMPERPATAVVSLARDWIRSRGGHRAPGTSTQHPWFAWLHVFDPHAPYRPPAPFAEQYAGQPYLGEVAATDAALAPLLDEVRASGQPTIVIVTADHGEALGDHGEESHGLFAYESTLRVPLIIAEWPVLPAVNQGVAKVGEVASTPARHVDILPTILDAIDRPAPRELPGRTLLAAAERRGHAAPRPSYFEAMSGMLNSGWAPLRGVLVERDKFIDLPIRERYELGADPSERTNRFGRDPQHDRTLSAVLDGLHATPPGERVTEDAETASRLQALGYVSGSAPRRQNYTEADDPKRLLELDRLVHRAVDAFAAGRSGEAVQLYRSIIDQRPDTAIAYRHLAHIEALRGNAAGAIDLLRRAIRSGVTDRRVVTQLAGYVADVGHVDEAIRLLEPFVDDEQADADTLNTLGIAYAQAHRGAAARRTFEQVAAINPTSSVPLENLGMLALERGDLIDARRQYERARDIDPRSSRAHSGLGTAALRSGDREMAVEEWSRAVELDSRNFDALYNIGTTLARGGQMVRARPYLEQFLRTASSPALAADRREVARLLGR
jgi:arylsulfatase A-like enzyme/Flp pilus assembly protein TadD